MAIIAKKKNDNFAIKLILICSNLGTMHAISPVAQCRKIYVMYRYLGLNRQWTTRCTMMLIIRANDCSKLHCSSSPTSKPRGNLHTKQLCRESFLQASYLKTGENSHLYFYYKGDFHEAEKMEKYLMSL